MAEKNKIYALIVGISNYENPQKVRSLSAPVNDAQQIIKFINNYYSKEYDIYTVTLLNEKATKKAISNTFLEHLGKAAEGDIAFFYFSGHGSQEVAHEYFWSRGESDGKCETLVCYDSRSTDKDLSDKELYYLIHKISTRNPHIIILQDSCHSGHATRHEIRVDTETVNKYETKWVKQLAPKRNWEEYCFYGDKFSEEIVKTAQPLSKDFLERYPEGNHIHIAACEPYELSKTWAGFKDLDNPNQTKSYSLMTYYLLKTLTATNGQISYYDLVERTKIMIRNHFSTYPPLDEAQNPIPMSQTPMLYSTVTNNNFNTFFNAKNNSILSDFVIAEYVTKKGWIINIGSLNGVKLKSLVLLFSDQTSKTYKGSISNVELDKSVVTFSPADKIDTNFLWKAVIEKPIQYSMNVCVEDAIWSLFKQVGANDILGDKLFPFYQNIHFLDNSQKEIAAYCIKSADNQLYLSYPTDDLPIVRQIKGISINSAAEIIRQLHHISQVEFFKRFYNPQATTILSNSSIALEFLLQTPEGEELLYKESNGEILKIENGNYRKLSYTDNIQLLIRVRNLTNMPLYVGLMELSPLFGICPNIFNGVVIHLAPFATEYANKKEAVKFTLKDYLKVFRHKELTYYYKMVVSTHLFDLSKTLKNGLPEPEMPNGHRISATNPNTTFRGDENNRPTIYEWTTELVKLSILNPYS